MRMMKVYEDRVEGEGIRGRPTTKWTCRVNEYLREGGVSGVSGKELNALGGSAGVKEVGNASAVAIPLW